MSMMKHMRLVACQNSITTECWNSFIQYIFFTMWRPLMIDSETMMLSFRVGLYTILKCSWTFKVSKKSFDAFFGSLQT